MLASYFNDGMRTLRINPFLCFLEYEHQREKKNKEPEEH